MELPKSEQFQKDISLNGLEQIFVQVTNPNSLEQSLNKSEQALIIDEQSSEGQCESFELVTMAEAARRLKMPYPTLRRHVLSGKIQSALGIDGKPLVKMQKAEYSKDQSEHSEYSTEQNGMQSEFSPNIQRLIDSLSNEREYSRALSEKLAAASYRNGYLEAQLSAATAELKLLPDLSAKATRTDQLESEIIALRSELEKQAKDGWLQRFGKWFLGNNQ
ncbi:MAG: hypothetical protein K2Z81_10985 [Cyanobacteria bacterium]|nr:hypothetical protein [Cyanobacteriota bacterium]